MPVVGGMATSVFKTVGKATAITRGGSSATLPSRARG